MKLIKQLHGTLATLFLFSFCVFAQAQTSQIDSLNRLVLVAKSVTARINLLLQKAKLLDALTIDSAIALANDILIMAKNSSYPKGQIAASHILVRDY